MENFDRTVLWGIVLDLPNSSTLNLLKESLVKYLVDSGMTARMYVALPEAQIPRDQGESVYFVSTYKPPVNFNVGTAFKDAVTIIGERNENCEKYVVLITDNFLAPKNQMYRKPMMMNLVRGYDSKIIVFGLANADRVVLKSIATNNESQYFDLDDPSTIGAELTRILET